MAEGTPSTLKLAIIFTFRIEWVCAKLSVLSKFHKANIAANVSNDVTNFEVLISSDTHIYSTRFKAFNVSGTKTWSIQLRFGVVVFPLFYFAIPSICFQLKYDLVYIYIHG